MEGREGKLISRERESRERPFVPLFMPEWGNEIIKLEAAATPCVIRGREATRTNVPDVRTHLIIT